MSKRQPCRCCKNDKPEPARIWDGYWYNRLHGKAQDWAKDNGHAWSEFCVPVKDGKRFGGPEWINRKCGNGRLGFPTRRKRVDEVRIEIGQDGQFKKGSKTLVRRRSASATASRWPRRVDGSRVGLVPLVAIKMAMRNPEKVEQQRQMHKKMVRAKNRNPKARRGHKMAVKVG